MIFRFGYILAVLMATPALAANPLTPAEETVCRNLSHCLSIVDDHPYDSFDYHVLAAEFSRFGPRGLRALVKRVGKGGDAAGHAADLLAIIADPLSLPGLKRIADAGGKDRSLAQRTIAAIEARQASYVSSDTATRPDARCLSHDPDIWQARKREMPYFESRIAPADRHGAYRPSATFRFETATPLSPQYKSRAWLRSAVRIPGGWIAAYPDALIRYDSRTGAPDMIAERCFLGVQSVRTQPPSGTVWTFSPGPDGATDIGSASSEGVHVIMRVMGPVTALDRLETGGLCLSSGDSETLHLKTDGTVEQGCLLQDTTP